MGKSLSLSLDNGTFCNDHTLLGRDEIYLASRGRGMLVSRLASMVR